MKKIIWKGSYTLTATAVLPEDATMQEVAEELAAQLDAKLNLCSSLYWDEVQNVEEVDVFE